MPRTRPASALLPLLGATITVAIAPAAASAAGATSRAADEGGSADPVVAAVSQDGPSKKKIPMPSPSGLNGGYVAKVLRTSMVRKRPFDRSAVIGTANDRTTYLGQGTRLLVVSARYDVDGHPWIRVQLPIRPNGTSGWMRAEDAYVRPTHWGIRVRLKSRRVEVAHYGRVVRRVGAVVGAPATPTPRGLFAIYEVAPQRDKRGFTGPWALNLTGFSTVLESFGSGPGRVAIHGRAGASFRDPLGTARSHGCVRIDNDVVAWMQRNLLGGTPVRITTD